MKEYNVYVEYEAANGKRLPAWAWLERALEEEFGAFAKSTAEHVGSWGHGDRKLQGKIRAYSVVGDEARARVFFQQLKKRMEQKGHAEIVILEKERSGPKGEPAGERV